MTDLRPAITAALDTDGVHPGDDRWYGAYELFFGKLKDHTVEEALNEAFDLVGASDNELRANARSNFWVAFNETRTKSSRRGSKGFLGKLSDNLQESFAPNPKHHD